MAATNTKQTLCTPTRSANTASFHVVDENGVKSSGANNYSQVAAGAGSLGQVSGDLSARNVRLF